MIYKQIHRKSDFQIYPTNVITNFIVRSIFLAPEKIFLKKF
jgi:hypothetical protein